MPEPDPQATTRTRCAACGFENIGHTLFCQDCGARLPTPPPSYQKPTAPAPQPATRPARIRSMHRVGGWRTLAGVTLRVLVYAAVTAFFIQLIRPPRTLPPPVAGLPAATASAEFRNLLGNAAAGQTIVPRWNFLNAYLAARLIPAGDAPSGFVRAALTPWRDGFTLFVQQRVLHLPLTTTMQVRIVARSNGLALEPVAASIGRIPMPPWAHGLVAMINGGLVSALSEEIDALRNARAVAITADSIRLDFAPRSP